MVIQHFWFRCTPQPNWDFSPAPNRRHHQLATAEAPCRRNPSCGARAQRSGKPGIYATNWGGPYPICSMVLEYFFNMFILITPRFGKYLSTMEHMGSYGYVFSPQLLGTSGHIKNVMTIWVEKHITKLGGISPPIIKRGTWMVINICFSRTCIKWWMCSIAMFDEGDGQFRCEILLTSLTVSFHRVTKKKVHPRDLRYP